MLLQIFDLATRNIIGDSGLDEFVAAILEREGCELLPLVVCDVEINRLPERGIIRLLFQFLFQLEVVLPVS